MATSNEPDVAVKINSAQPVHFGGIVCTVTPRGEAMGSRIDGEPPYGGIQPSGAYLMYDRRFDDPTFYTA